MLTIKSRGNKVIEKTVEVIKNGGLVVFPSDTVYGLFVDATNQKAVEKLLAFKDRWTGKAISVAVRDKKMAGDFVEITDQVNNIIDNLLPGPFTIIAPGKHKVAKGIEAENGTLGIRMPDYEPIKKLVRLVGRPVTATSANLSGRRPHYSIESFLKTLSKRKREMIDLLVDGGKLPRNLPSTVIDASLPSLKVLRRGDVVVDGAKSIITKSEKETGKVAEWIFKRFFDCHAPNSSGARNDVSVVFLLTGELGCGKTVFVRAMGKILGVTERITSPTFVIMNCYKITNNQAPITKQIPNYNLQNTNFLHFDLYRIKDQYELEEIRLWNQFTPGTVACIEWPENLGKENLEKLKKIARTVTVGFEYVDEGTRRVRYDL
ncbi:MAG: L-threonylcarbamoyladenylate synthase [Candidatus Shapirobacteria bacterium]|jgi:L-threonylcarbamoyladenylate synthase